MIQIKEDYEPQFGIFHDLMRFRVREILLVSSFYDAFVIEEDGGLSERIFNEYSDFNLWFIPKITRVSTASEALHALKKNTYDVVITMSRISDMNLLEFGRKVKKLKPGMPVILLTYEWVDIPLLIRLRESKVIDKVFYWNGNSRILLAIIKYIEDLKNVDNDTNLGVRVILIIEDSPRFYSIFLPLIYSEIMTQTRALISEGVNALHRQLRMRARPKILMAETYEQGQKICKKYKDSLLGVISDVRFPRKGEIDINAGFKLARKLKGEIPDLPFLVQSSNMENKDVALKEGLGFLYKHSENLLEELHAYILSHFGFGDFVFTTEKGEELGRATNLSEFEEKLQTIPIESILYHAARNHISIWLRARTEFEGAEILRPMKVSDFANVDELRKLIVGEIVKLNLQHHLGQITDFGQVKLDSQNSFVRIEGGSLGGKARGIAFLNALLAKYKLADRFQNVEIRTPHTAVICSDVFEKFIRENSLQEFAIQATDNRIIAQRFLQCPFPEHITTILKSLLIEMDYPIAVRSSSLLEDSQMLPFAGLYSTFMLPNNSPNHETRLTQLCDALKLVFASVFYKSPKEYVKNTNFRIEEEKMAVIIQQIVGQNYNDKYYPVISGTAQSYNHYPISHQESDDGVVQLALGLGIIVAEGNQIFRVSPKYPEMNPPFSSAAEFLHRSQSYFYALDLTNKELQVSNNEKCSLIHCTLNQAEQDGSLFFVASTYCGQDNAIRDTISIPGPRVITFANILKYNVFPLPEILTQLLAIGRQSFGSHIEMEFAVNIFKDKTKNPQFYLLQIRPMVAGQEDIEITLDDTHVESLFCSSHHAMGNGVIDQLSDIVYVDPDTFDISQSRLIAAEVGELNKKLAAENRKYILIGYGRWGTSDPWLGIPVEWHQISNARIVIESNLGGFNIDPSQGSHFFHNLISLKMGYFHIKKTSPDEFIDWPWLQQQKNLADATYVKHVRLQENVIAKINARISRGAIFKQKNLFKTN